MIMNHIHQINYYNKKIWDTILNKVSQIFSLLIAKWKINKKTKIPVYEILKDAFADKDIVSTIDTDISKGDK